MRWKRASGYKPYIECKEGSERDAVEKRDVHAHGRSRVSVKRRGAALHKPSRKRPRCRTSTTQGLGQQEKA